MPYWCRIVLLLLAGVQAQASLWAGALAADSMAADSAAGIVWVAAVAEAIVVVATDYRVAVVA